MAMDNSLLLLWLTLRELKTYNLKDVYKGARVLQKVFFMLQEGGLPFGYHFIWYVYGPMSDLLRDQIFNCEHYQDDFLYRDKPLSEYRLSPNISQKINLIMNGLRSETPGITMEDQLLVAGTVLAFVRWEDMIPADAITEVKKRFSKWPFDEDMMQHFIRSFLAEEKDVAAA